MNFDLLRSHSFMKLFFFIIFFKVVNEGTIFDFLCWAARSQEWEYLAQWSINKLMSLFKESIRQNNLLTKVLLILDMAENIYQLSLINH